MFWICKNCFSLYDVNVGKCRECGGTELIQKETEEKVEFVTAAPPPVPGTSPQVPETPLAETEAEEDLAASSIYPAGKDAVKALQRALVFIQKIQKKDFQNRCRKYEPRYQHLSAQYEKEVRQFRMEIIQYEEYQKRAKREIFWIRMIFNFGFLFFLYFFWGYIKKEEFALIVWMITLTAFVTLIANAIFLAIWKALSRNCIEAAKGGPMPPKAPEEQPPYPDTDADFERYFELYPDAPTGKEYFRPMVIQRLIGILENRLAETIPEAMRFMLAEDRANREHQEEMRVMHEMNRHAQEAASSAASAASAARKASTMATLGTALQAIDMANRRK